LTPYDNPAEVSGLSLSSSEPALRLLWWIDKESMKISYGVDRRVNGMLQSRKNCALRVNFSERAMGIDRETLIFILILAVIALIAAKF